MLQNKNQVFQCLNVVLIDYDNELRMKLWVKCFHMSEMFSLKISSTINDTGFYFLSDSHSNGNVCNYS